MCKMKMLIGWFYILMYVCMYINFNCDPFYEQNFEKNLKKGELNKSE